MTRRKRGAAATAANYWPGYVDALTNVVLNLLFLIAMFGIALAVMNSAPRAAGGRQADAAVGRASENGSADGPGGAAAVALVRGERAALVPGAPLGPVGGLRDRGADLVTDLATPPPASPSADPAGPGPAGATRLAASLPSPAGLGGDPAGDAGARPGGNALAPGAPRSGPEARAGGYPFAGVPQAQLDFLVADAYQRRLMPGVRVVRQADPAGGVLVTVTLAIGTEPVAALQQAGFRTSLRVSLAGQGDPGASRLRLWTATRLADPVLRRTAYLALIEARNQLLALGYPAGSIEMRLIEGSTIGRDGKQLYIHAVPATTN